MTGKEVEPAVSDEAEVQIVRPPAPVPRDLQRVDSLAEVATHPDGTVLVWHQWTGHDYERQSGVLITSSSGERDVLPISIGFYEDDLRLRMVDPPVWLLTFNDPLPDRDVSPEGEYVSHA